MKRLVRFSTLTVLTGALAAANAYMMREPVNTSPIFANGHGKADVALSTADGQTSINAVSDLKFVQSFSRPLFSPDRRKFRAPQEAKKPKPEPKPAVARKEPPVEPPAIKLVGVSISQFASKALISIDGDPNSKWIGQGEAIGPWTVSEINSNILVMKNQNREMAYSLHPESE